MKKVKVLDCTCRDGGYYNLWNFKIHEINNYLQACYKSKIDIVEIGFVFPKKNLHLGPFAYSKKSLFDKLIIPNNLSICVMINAKDFYNINVNEVNKIFGHSKKNFFKIVRVAINFDEFQKGMEITKSLKKLGYKIGFNLMQAHNKSTNQIKNVGQAVSKFNSIDYLYFADSLGVMDPMYVRFFCKTLRRFWKKDIGIHAHNNKSFALLNSIEAIESGATMVDSTILGMGRGAGNVCTENLLCELKSKKYKYKPENLINILPYFESLKNKYKWGPSYFYHFSSVNNIHPSYIQKVISSPKYNYSQIGKILGNLSKQNSHVFSQDNLDNEVYKSNVSENLPKFNATNFFLNKKILILGSGETGKNELKQVKEFIKKNKPTVLSLNNNPFLNSRYIDFYVCCYDYRVYFELSEILRNKKPVIIPIQKFKKNIGFQLNNKKIINYDLIIKNYSFNSFPEYCEIDKPLALAYALAFCQEANPASVNFAFIDGYKNDIKENKYLTQVINKFEKKNSKKINFITTTILN
mgnify:CR=1 FL=1|jgi:4-hydroxy 2-oxovalerate aldolase